MSATNSKGFHFKYSSGIAPLVTTKEYTDLIKNYKATGKFPHILKLGGMAIDTSRNRNKWRVPMDDLKDIAAQLQGAPLMKDHDIDHVDSIIGKVEEAWVEPDADDPSAGKVMWKGECSDENLIQKILLGYVKFNSIQIAVPQAYCDDCMTKQGKSEEQAAIADLDLPCPRCGGLDMLIRHPMVLEQSMVAIPAYSKAEVAPVGFKASVDKTLQKRFERGIVVNKVKAKLPDLTPLLLKARFMVNMVALSVAELSLKMASIDLDNAQIDDEQAPEGYYPGEDTSERGFDMDVNFSHRLPKKDSEPCELCQGPNGHLIPGGIFLCNECDKATSPTGKGEAGGSLSDFPLVEKKRRV